MFPIRERSGEFIYIAQTPLHKPGETIKTFRVLETLINTVEIAEYVLFCTQEIIKCLSNSPIEHGDIKSDNIVVILTN